LPVELLYKLYVWLQSVPLSAVILLVDLALVVSWTSMSLTD